MPVRTSDIVVTFARPFVLKGFDMLLGPGDYRVETDDELLGGVSFPAYRRLSTLFHLDNIPGQPGITQTLIIDAKDLDAALLRDSAIVEIPNDLRWGYSPGSSGQTSERQLTVIPPLSSEPSLSSLIADPIVRLLMRSDKLSAVAVWRAFENARANLIVRSVREK